jgi:cation diffusion facilitator family transporter
MGDCGCGAGEVDTSAQRRALSIALALNAVMFVVEVAAGWLANSTGLVADGLDMLTDASAYGIALVAIGRSPAFKARAATLSGVLLLLVGAGLLADIARRVWAGGEPAGGWMMAVALAALAVNIFVLRLLARNRSDEVHLRAAWIFTRADVVANAAVIASGAAVIATGIRYFDLVVGAAIGLWVGREAFQILAEAKAARARA